MRSSGIMINVGGSIAATSRSTAASSSTTGHHKIFTSAYLVIKLWWGLPRGVLRTAVARVEVRDVLLRYLCSLCALHLRPRHSLVQRCTSNLCQEPSYNMI